MGSDDASSPSRRLQLFLLAGCTVCVPGLWLLFSEPHAPQDNPPPDSINIPRPVLQSAHRNALKADFTGSDRCVRCHAAEAQAYRSTPHSHSLERVSVHAEPPDGQFSHKTSGRRYRIERRAGELWHQEVVDDDVPDEFLLGEYPVAWRIGSGHHSRSYLVEIDGYLLESPVTWYASQGFWSVSPGYDIPMHEGFGRAAHEGCIQCHSGRVEPVGNSTHRLRVIEPAIGCESCHGPGSLHVGERSKGLPVTGSFDDSIVHPGKLSRALNEAICAQCHLRGAGWSYVRGRTHSDFQPGLPLTDVRVDFVRETASGSMRVVGHFEQMRASRCYTESDTLTCTTCHNPHASPAPDQAAAYFRKLCQQGCDPSSPRFYAAVLRGIDT